MAKKTKAVIEAERRKWVEDFLVDSGIQPSKIGFYYLTEVILAYEPGKTIRSISRDIVDKMYPNTNVMAFERAIGSAVSCATARYNAKALITAAALKLRQRGAE